MACIYFFESRNFLPKSLGLGFLTRISASRRVSDFTIRHPYLKYMQRVVVRTSTVVRQRTMSELWRFVCLQQRSSKVSWNYTWNLTALNPQGIYTLHYTFHSTIENFSACCNTSCGTKLAASQADRLRSACSLASNISLCPNLFSKITMKLTFQFFNFWTPEVPFHTVQTYFKFVVSFFRIMRIIISMERIWLMLVDAATFLPVSACICCGSILSLF